MTDASPVSPSNTPQKPPNDPRALRQAFGAFMTGVTVVTTLDGDGKPLGFTANSFTSVSLDPPLLLVALSRRSANREAFTTGQGFAVNILAEGQRDLSNTFARPADDRFAAVDWRPGPAGSPLLADVSAWFDCTLHQVVDAGDHDLLIGRVAAFEALQEPGLGYYRGNYFTPAETEATLAASPDVIVSALVTVGSEVLLVEDESGGQTLPSIRVGKEGMRAALEGLITATGVAATPGFIYAIYEDTARSRQHVAFLCPVPPPSPSPSPSPRLSDPPTIGHFTAPTPEVTQRIADGALRAMLDRFAEESRVGAFGIYHGTQDAGQVTRFDERKRP